MQTLYGYNAHASLRQVAQLAYDIVSQRHCFNLQPTVMGHCRLNARINVGQGRHQPTKFDVRFVPKADICAAAK